MLATGLDYGKAGEYLEKSGGNVKTAIVMALCGLEKEEADSLLERSGGFVRKAVESRKSWRIGRLVG